MIVFLHIPKTGGTTFQFILENSLGIKHCHLGHLGLPVIEQSDLEFIRKFFPRLGGIAGHSLSDPLRLHIRDPFYITFLREPVNRVFSHYQDDVLRGRKQIAFEQMLHSDEVLKNIEVKRLAGKPDLGRAKLVLEKFHFAGLTEKFDLSLTVLQRLCPYKLNLNYKRKVTARDNSIANSLKNDSRMVAMTRDYNRLDLELYDFAVKEIFPKFCAQACVSPRDQVASYNKYTSDLHPIFLLHRLYNQTFFRQVCKIYRRRRRREPLGCKRQRTNR